MESYQIEILKAIHTQTHHIVRTGRLGFNSECLRRLYKLKTAVNNAIAELEKLTQL